MASSINAITTGSGGVVTTADNSGNLNLQSGGTTVVAVTSAGAAVTGTLSASTTGQVGTTLGVGAATPAASGAGITFPATQSASTNVNTLDDYEEGTWSPNQGAGLTVSGTYFSTGTYTKVGNIVNVTARQYASSSITVSSATGIICTNLPFTILNTGPANGWGVISNISGTVAGVINVSSTTVYNNGTSIPSTSGIYYSVTYQADS